MSTIPQLPNEAIEAILLCLPPLPHSNESARTICNVGLANSRFLAVSRSPHIWQPHYAARWRRSDAAREQSRKSSTHEDWRAMYYARIELDRKALDLLDAIVSQTDNRTLLAVQLANDCGYDVWETISKETTRVRRREYSRFDVQKIPIEGLTRQYWAREIIGVVSRCRAVNIWLPLSNHGPMAEDISFEEGLAAMSGFFRADIDTVFEEFDRLTLSCQEYLLTRGYTGESDPTATVIEICAWMRQRGFVKPNEPSFLHVLNHFPHHFLFEQPVILPIALVYIFVCVSRRLGLNARPVAFPNKVLAMISPPAGHAIYVDVFESESRPVVSYTSDLPAMLEAMGLDPSTLPEHASPATTSTMLLRAARNTVHSLDRAMWRNDPDQTSAHDAAYCAALVLTGDARMIPTLFAGLVGPLDGEAVVRNVLRPGLPEAIRDRLDRRLTKQEEYEKYVPKINGRGQVQHFTGMMFRHVKYRYLGVIKGWDYDCRLGKEWISQMRVDELPRGSNQPFYHSFTGDGRVKYVAEENIKLIHRPYPSELRLIFAANKDLGRWFDGVEFRGSKPVRFIMSPESRALYPDDDMVGRRFRCPATEEDSDDEMGELFLTFPEED
ncbi:hypothetical protein JB92DRAFT_2967785 [Gautieria morchelliformis]|nr:hypothetical protein JB92DRAFT_2967785 [Gautieria morchelliformis]